ncbi:hypothetical protein [Candidatus Methylobacter oryzae]|uniref:Uncharacterized protein n=1 Tax=Candidatus Methylobacter oryzae TaxID=2497749 RepID=A0ABY3CDU0_9GAMM|nr:hypothetical protein [Candidatus Methylobacter oryzae]TRX00893.1 hypothetical protein EKO24_004635 [Candidatus Methylobacter oryzae]
MKLFFVFILNSLIAVNTAYAQVDETTVEEIVKNSPCIGGLSIDAALKDKIKIRSQRDLGWQVFKEEGQLDVERAFLMNKSMQLRFRWRVNPDGSINPVSSRAESLCTE